LSITSPVTAPGSNSRGAAGARREQAAVGDLTAHDERRIGAFTDHFAVILHGDIHAAESVRSGAQALIGAEHHQRRSHRCRR
jgi:hypothetical protein